jgi:hypothetical protein
VVVVVEVEVELVVVVVVVVVVGGPEDTTISTALPGGTVVPAGGFDETTSFAGNDDVTYVCVPTLRPTCPSNCPA